MEFKEAVEKLEKSSEFSEWKEQNEGCNLSYALCITEEGKKNQWAIGYHNNSTDKTVSFSVDDEIKIGSEEEVFKKDETVIRELDIGNVKLTLKQALEKADKINREKYPREIPTKKIAIVQHIDKGEVWNITYITKSFNVLNFKIGAEKGDLISCDISSVLSFRQN